MSAQLATVVVTDLVSSTKLRADLGEEAADQLHRRHTRMLRALAEINGGSVVKGLGDGVLARFGGAACALAAAVAMQQAAATERRRQPETPLVLRIGMSVGDVAVEHDGDLLGTPVIEAARLCGAARGGQILATTVVPHLAHGRGGFICDPVGDLELKGIPEPVPVVEVRWGAGPGAGLTDVRLDPGTAERPRVALVS